MNNFNPQRFSLLLKHEIIENGRSYLRFYLGVFATFFLIIFAMTYNLCLHPEAEMSIYSNWIGNVVSLCNPLVFILSLVTASYIFSNMADKQGRIRFLMIPATNMEKFLCRWLQFCLLGPLMLIVAFSAADITCWLLRVIIGEGLGVATPYFLESIIKSLFVKTLWDVEIMVDSVNLSGFVNLYVFISAYLLGGTVFRRVPYIFTTLAGIAIGFFVVIFLLTFAGTLLSQTSFPAFVEWMENHKDLAEFLEMGEYLYWIIPFGWIAFCHFMSYRMFCRAGIITNKRLGL